jgi:UDP:flavonoid glycosyltransferase YjiC (YdhE family)
MAPQETLGWMRVLIASGPGAGHVTPLLAFVDALAGRGDEVLLVVAPELAATAAATGQPYRLGARPPADVLDPLWARFEVAPPSEAAVIANREIFGRLNTAAMLPAMEDAFASWRPEVVLREPCEYASAITAQRAGLAHAQVGISQAAIEASATELVAPALEPYGDDVVPGLLAAPYLTRFPAALDPSPYAVTWRYREASPPSRPLPDWWDGRDAPLVYVTFGSVAGSLPVVRSVYRTALDAVAALDARVLVTVGRDVDVATFGPLAANTRVEAWVPQHDVLPEAAVVVCHGGSGTTFGALAAGVPLVFVPMFADQRPNAEQVAALGAGLVVHPPAGVEGGMAGLTDADVPRLRAAIERVLGDPSYRHAAGRIAAAMAAEATIDEILGRLGALIR